MSQCATYYVQDYMLFAAEALEWTDGHCMHKLLAPWYALNLHSENIHLPKGLRQISIDNPVKDHGSTARGE
jgi:hypothetical protein